MEFHAITPKGVAHVCSVHRGAGDLSPLQMISVQELVRLQRVEAAHILLVAALRDARRRSRKSKMQEQASAK